MLEMSRTNENINRVRKANAKRLNDLYYTARDTGSYGGVERLYRRAKEVGIPVNRADVVDYLARQLP